MKRSVNTVTVRRGDIYYADLSPVVGSEQGGVRPVLIVQNDMGNRYSPTVIAAAITSQKTKANLPTHILLQRQTTGLSRDSIVLLEQIRTIEAPAEGKDGPHRRRRHAADRPGAVHQLWAGAEQLRNRPAKQ